MDQLSAGDELEPGQQENPRECRELHAASVPGLETVAVLVDDAAGAGGANHRYVIEARIGGGIRCFPIVPPMATLIVEFQRGPVQEVGVNGVTNEALLAIVADRLCGFQAGPYPCEENALALHHVDMALSSLHRRTLARASQGVEGTSAAHRPAPRAPRLIPEEEGPA